MLITKLARWLLEHPEAKHDQWWKFAGELYGGEVPCDQLDFSRQIVVQNRIIHDVEAIGQIVAARKLRSMTEAELKDQIPFGRRIAVREFKRRDRVRFGRTERKAK